MAEGTKLRKVVMEVLGELEEGPVHGQRDRCLSTCLRLGLGLPLLEWQDDHEDLPLLRSVRALLHEDGQKEHPDLEERVRQLEKDFYAMVHAQREMADRICSPVIRQLEAKLDHIVDGVARMDMLRPTQVVVPMESIDGALKDKLPDMVCPVCGDSTFRLEQYTSGQEWTCATCKNRWKAE
jgi:hypothetical protein